MVLQHANRDFDINSVKSRHFYKLLLSKKSKLPNVSNRLINDFDVIFCPTMLQVRPMYGPVQYRLLSYILFTNIKLFKIGLSLTDQCTFCNLNEETLYHLFFECSRVQGFWECFVDWWRDVAHENLTMTIKDVMLGFRPERKDIINYLLILGKLCIWECKRSNCPLNFNLFLYKIGLKEETESHIAIKNGTLNDFNRRGGLTLRSVKMTCYGHSRLIFLIESGLANVIFRLSKHLPKLLLLSVCVCMCVFVLGCSVAFHTY